jgi:hypothetical protein
VNVLFEARKTFGRMDNTHQDFGWFSYVLGPIEGPKTIAALLISRLKWSIWDLDNPDAEPAALAVVLALLPSEHPMQAKRMGPSSLWIRCEAKGQHHDWMPIIQGAQSYLLNNPCAGTWQVQRVSRSSDG